MLRGGASEEETDAFYRRHLASAEDETYTFGFQEHLLQKIATMNPVVTTLFYEQVADAVFTNLVGLPPSSERKITPSQSDAKRRRGIFGMPFA